MKLTSHVIENSTEAFPPILLTSSSRALRHSRRSSERNSRARLDRSPLPFVLALLLATLGPLTTTFATVQSPLADDFNPGARRSVSSLALQVDGKILTGGEFTTLGGQPRHHLGRLYPDGRLDLTFNTVANGRVNSLIVQADGKVLVGGYFTTLGGQTRTNLGRLNPDGTLDSTFNPGAGGSEYASVYCLALQTDGKILVGGFFTTLDGQPRNRIGRLNPDGTLDSTFNPGANGSVYSLVVQTDGKVLVGGDFTTLGGQTRTNLGRLNPDGALDHTFKSGANYRVNSLALQADGKILVGGYFTKLGGQTRNGVGQLNQDGTLDPTFNPGIAGIISEDDEPQITSLVVQADGKILVGGTFTMLGGQARKCLGRLHPGGALDTTFNTGANYAVESLAVQADGKILVGGYFTTLGGQTRNGIGRLDNTGPATEMLSHDGSTITWLRGGASPEVWRTTFESSADGLSWTFLGTGTRLSGGWQLAGLSLATAAILRARGYAAGGSQNASGWFIESYTGRPTLVLQPTAQTNDASTAARFWIGADGTEPLTYQWFKDAMPRADLENVTGATSPALILSSVLKADEGAYQVVVSNLYGSVTSLVATLTVMDPVILVPPWSTNRSAGESVSLSVTAGGTPPLNYQWYHNGLMMMGATGPSLTIGHLSEADAGYYIVEVSNAYGRVTSPPHLLTVNLVSADADFSLVTFGGWGSESYAVLNVQPDGKILVGGSFTTLGGHPRYNLGRLNPDGTLDPIFNPAANYDVTCLALQPDGKVLVGGYFTELGGQARERIGRLNSDGTLDPTFNSPPLIGEVYSLALQADGKILVAGRIFEWGGQSRYPIARLNPNGTLDPAFNPGALGAPYDSVSFVALQTDEKILVGGNFTTLGGQPRNHLGRLNPNGSLDLTFNPEAGGAAYDAVSSLALQADGKILVGGHFTTLGEQMRTNLGRLNPDGTLDSTFNPGANGWVNSLVVQTDGKILVGGSFTALGGHPRNRIGRLDPDGTLDATFNPGTYYAALQADGKILVALPEGGIARIHNTGPATQVLSHNGSAITWLRGGTGPELWRTTFEHSADGVNWTLLGDATRISGGWQLPGLSVLPAGTLRARGFAAGGLGNASGWSVETTWSGPVPIRLRVVREGPMVVLNWTGGQGPYQVERTADLSRPDAWQNVGPTSRTNSMTLPLGPNTLFLRVRGQ